MEEVAATPLRVPSCKTLGCSLCLGHAGPCSNAVTGTRVRVLTDKAREASPAAQAERKEAAKAKRKQAAERSSRDPDEI